MLKAKFDNPVSFQAFDTLPLSTSPRQWAPVLALTSQ
jgi:hypothetical protein